MDRVKFFGRTRKIIHATLPWSGIDKYPVSSRYHSITEPKKVIADWNSNSELLANTKEERKLCHIYYVINPYDDSLLIWHASVKSANYPQLSDIADDQRFFSAEGQNHPMNMNRIPIAPRKYGSSSKLFDSI